MLRAPTDEGVGRVRVAADVQTLNERLSMISMDRDKRQSPKERKSKSAGACAPRARGSHTHVANHRRGKHGALQSAASKDSDDVDFCPPHRPCGGPEVPYEHVDCRTLSGPVRAQEAEHLPLFDRQREVPAGDLVARRAITIRTVTTTTAVSCGTRGTAPAAAAGPAEQPGREAVRLGESKGQDGHGGGAARAALGGAAGGAHIRGLRTDMGKKKRGEWERGVGVR